MTNNKVPIKNTYIIQQRLNSIMMDNVEEVSVETYARNRNSHHRQFLKPNDKDFGITYHHRRSVVEDDTATSLV